MSLPPDHPDLQNPRASSESKFSVSGRPRQSAWGLPSQPGSRRGLASLNTNLSAGTTESRRSVLTSPPVGTGPAFAWGPSATSLNNRTSSARHTTSASSSTLNFASLLGAQQQLSGSSQLLSSPRSRTNTPFSIQSASSAAAGPSAASSGGGGGSGSGSGGGQQPSRAGNFSPVGSSTHGLSSPTNAGFDRSSFGTSTPSGSGGSSLAKITVTQVFLLLGSITEKEGKKKWEAQAESIRKLVADHGMEVFARYFRRLVQGNAPTLFPEARGLRNVENPANYPLLVGELDKVAKDPDQARKIAEAIDTTDDNLFRDFDLSAFLRHFDLDGIQLQLLAFAFTRCSKADLREKANSFLALNLDHFISDLQNPSNTDNEPSAAAIAKAILQVFQNSGYQGPDATRKKHAIGVALEGRYKENNQPYPDEIRSVFMLIQLFEEGMALASDFLREGHTITSSVQTTEEAFRRFGRSEVNEEQIAGLLLAIVSAPDVDSWSLKNLATAIEHTVDGKVKFWQKVVSNFDRESVSVTRGQFLRLYNFLVPFAQKDSTFDIQALWGGQWSFPATQLSFAIGLTSLLPNELNAQTIPRLRKAYDVDQCLEGLEGFDELVKQAKHDTMISLDAVAAIMNVVWSASDAIPPHVVANARNVIQQKITLFLCSCAAIPEPWSNSQTEFIDKFMGNCLFKVQDDYQFILHCFWRQNRGWTAQKLYDFHAADPMKLPLILEHAQEHNWLDELCTTTTGFGIDLAALAHRRGLIDLQQWIADKVTRGMTEMGSIIAKFLDIKAQDEVRTANGDQIGSRTVILAMKTVFQMLQLLEDPLHKIPSVNLKPLQRLCVRAYPRIINFGGEWDELIENSGTNSNQLPATADAAMQDFYRRMYNQDLAVKDVIQILSQNKESTDPHQQDLFACMIHGLFDEYVCFAEYPLQPLATTAVLFGGMINYRLISGVALSVAKEMVLEAVREYPSDTSMFKFGLQALLHVLNRLPEWPEYCQELVQIPGLQGTEVYNHAQNALKESRSPAQNGETNGADHEPHLANGDLHSPGDSLIRHFMSISVEVPIDAGLYGEPEEEVQGKISFVLNNITDDSLQPKMDELLQVLQQRHYQWFAEQLVETRAKFQPNYQSLYLRILDIINNKGLWGDVLRETYVSVRKVMNAESTMKNAADRTHLKNLGTWLGSLTLARDKPIRHKNIAFRDLLIEGFETQRLLLVIPFTCEVLQQGAKSKVMKPPNPWVNDIISILMELYDMETTKIQQKFAIEFMLNTFGLPRQGEGIERSSEIRKRIAFQENEAVHTGALGDGLPDFGELAIGPRVSQRSPAALSVPDLSDQLIYPSTGSADQQSRVRAIVSNAVHQAIHDIVQPVVERSVTIASIATKDLIAKDFSLEMDGEKLRESYLSMVRPLASSLAHVTCKDPLKQCITNYMRTAASDAPEDVPEGTILMTINDNLEVACEHVRANAEERSVMEVDAIMDDEIAKRREHKARYPNEPYRDQAYSEWSKYLPEPYKLLAHGLNAQQLEIYQNFGPQARGIINHTQQGSTDSGRQIPDVLQDAMIPSMPNISTPAEQPVMPLQTSASQSRATPAISEAHGPDQIATYADYETTMQALHESLQQLDDLIARTPEKRWRDLTDDDPVYSECATIIQTIHQSPMGEGLAKQLGPHLCTAAYENPKSTFDIEVKIHLAYSVSTKSDEIMLALQGKLHRVVTELEPAKIDFVAVLLESGWIDYSFLDKRLAELISSGQPNAVEYISKLLDLLLFSSDPVALRADFALSISIIGRLANEGHVEVFKNVLDKLSRPSSLPTPISPTGDMTPDQVQAQYVLDEWLTLLAGLNVSESAYVVFLQNLRDNNITETNERLTNFFRQALSVATSMDTPEAFVVMDALAKLVLLLVKTQDVNKGSRPQFAKHLLMMVVVLMNHHQLIFKERFNARIFGRFFSTVIWEWHENNDNFAAEENQRIMIVLADILLLLDPHHFPGFVFAWLDLISHRIFLPLLLKNSGPNGELFAEMMVKLLKFACPLLHPERFSPAVRELYRGIIKLMLVLHHDFAEFLAQNHVRLCNVIPADNNQLRNLVLSAFPSSYTEIPDPMTVGLRVDRLDENKKAPELAQDGMSATLKEKAKDSIDTILKNDANSTAKIIELGDHMNSWHPDQGPQVVEACFALSHFVVLYLAETSIKANKQSASTHAFDETSLQAHVFVELTKILRPDTRYYFLSAMLNQLRFPNSHTHYFNYAILHIWTDEQKRSETSQASDDGNEEHENKQGDVREQISRLFLERLMVHKPHPWGLLLAMMELFKNTEHGFWNQSFIRATPEAKRVFATLFEIFDNGQRAMP